MNRSIWQNSKTNLITTRRNLETDILIVGGGITGISTLLNLKDENVILIDSNKIGENVTAKSTAKISVMQEYNYQKIQCVLGKNICDRYLKSQVDALNMLVSTIKRYKIDCDLKENSSYLFTNNEKNIDKIIKEKSILDKEIKTKVVSQLPNNYPCIYGLETVSYVFNPVLYMLEIKNLCRDKIYENVRALKIEKKLDYFLVKTNKNKIKAKKVIICTHYPILVKKFLIPLKTTIEKEYFLSAKVDKSYSANMISYDDELTSIRYYDDYMLFAGYKSKLCDSFNHRENMNDLIKKYRSHFMYPIINTWYNFDITSNDYLPIIGEVKNGIYIATAYNKWGMTNGFLASKILSDLVLNKNNEYADLFSFYRPTNIKKIFNSILYSFYNVKALLFNKQKYVVHKWSCGEQFSIYDDHEVINKCPHMGCKLIFNQLDNTWDCPCHGSRYTSDGMIIKGPSVKSIHKLNKKNN